MKTISVLGSTGSIGRSALDVIARHPDRYSVHALTANSRVADLFEQCRTFNPVHAVLGDEAAAHEFQDLCCRHALDVEVHHGADALEAVASGDTVDIVIAAIVGAAGLLSTLAAARAGKRLLLANKEALVMSGQLLMQAAADADALIMPIDSEHNAIFQSLPATEKGICTRGIEKILLTASGGPLRNCSLEELRVVTPQQALKHPNWSMGPKISIDSATLMNKGLEVIEACQLFAVDVDDVQVVVHPESIVHSMVSYADGSVIAQMGQPDMRTPIAHALAWPERITSGVEPLDFFMVSGLHFEKPDTDRFPLLRVACEAQRQGGTAPAILNAANEVAVDAFLDGRVAFLQLSALVEKTLECSKISPANDLGTIIEADKTARDTARQLIAQAAVKTH
ncbi:MAG: 1-deoxy-D-xylulose-5-phosphate reductoisomerase [Granulosicoccus sp.]|nr:1-deoxy-D-xylulose-5-phosphate reductoisomerase [Granulosicoccus sp.]